jgi:tRNA dimethylallyltransferase
MTLLALVGPTASGKSAVALALAERSPIEIVSMDSVQVYRGLDIGSAKPTPDERARVPHHLVDLVEADARFSTADWLHACDAAIAGIRARGKIPLVVGGTGLYWRALTDGRAELPSADDALRAQLAADEAASPGALHARLVLVDPVTAARLAPRDLVRVVRALEVHKLSGVPLSQHHDTQASSRPRFETIAIDLPDADLRAAIEARVTRMIDAGLVEEARALRARHGAVRPLEAVGYRQALDETIEPASLQPAIATATWQFARRQRTWFRRAGARSPADALGKLLELLDGAR